MSFVGPNKKGWSILYPKTREHVVSHHLTNSTKSPGFFPYILGNITTTKVTRLPIKHRVRSGQVSTRSPYATEKGEKNVTMFDSLKGRILFSKKHREFPEAKFFWDLKTHLGCLVILHFFLKLWSSSLCGEVWFQVFVSF